MHKVPLELFRPHLHKQLKRDPTGEHLGDTAVVAAAEEAQHNLAKAGGRGRVKLRGNEVYEFDRHNLHPCHDYNFMATKLKRSKTFYRKIDLRTA